MNNTSQLDMLLHTYKRYATKAMSAFALTGVFACAAATAQAQTTVVRGNQLQLFNSAGTQSTSIMLSNSQASTYSLTLPTSSPALGSLLYLSSSGGQTAWTNSPVAGQVLVAQGSGLVPTWTDLTSILPGIWSTSGNTSNAAGAFLGTTDAQPLILKTKGSEAFRLDTNGRLGIGTGTTVSERLTLQDGNLLLSNTGTRGEIHLQEASANGSNYVGIRASTNIASNYTVTLPAAGPSAGGQVLRTSESTPSDLVWSNLNIARFIRKTANQTQTVTLNLGQTLLDEDDDLHATVEANATYIFDMYLKVRKSSILAAADFAFQFDAPANSEVSFGYSSSGALIANSVVDVLGVNTGGIGVTALGGNYTYVSVKGILKTGNTDGTLAMSWGTSGLLALGLSYTVAQDSYMTITRVE